MISDTGRYSSYLKAPCPAKTFSLLRATLLARITNCDMDHEPKNRDSDPKRETSSLSLNGEFPDSHEGSEADVESLASLQKQKDNATEFKGRHIQMMALGT